jgi:hypothetical protein
MARTLKCAIQIFWAILGIYSLVMLIGMLGYQLFGHSPDSLDLAGYLFELPIIFLFTAIVYTACVALFRFSFAVVGPTVFIASVIMFTIAMHGMTHDLQPMLNPRLHPLTVAFLDLLALFVVIFGTFRFYRVTLAAIQKTLFPELNHSAARIF